MPTGSPARVVFNALALRPGGSGVQTYQRELLRGLAGVLDADLGAIVQSDAVGELPSAVSPVLRPPSSGVRRALTGWRAREACDLFHGLDVDLPVRPGEPTVSTVHDLSVFDVPWAYSRKKVVGERVLGGASIKRADALVAVSTFTAERVRARFGRECTVIGESPPSDMRPATAAEVERVRDLYFLPACFVLHVGTVEPRKNLDVLARAAAIARVPLVLAGMRGAARVPSYWTISIGYAPRELLPALYNAATVVAVSSRYEGFGLPAVEAMACGAPVVASRIPPLVESLGQDAVLVAPDDAEAWAAEIRDLCHDGARREELAARGRARVATMSWRAVAEATAGVYRSLGVPV